MCWRCTVDTDVVVIALYAFWDLDLEELWIEFDRGKNRKSLPVHAYAKALGKEICSAVLFWYTFHDKKWNTWERFLEATETFIRLSCVLKLSQSDIRRL